MILTVSSDTPWRNGSYVLYKLFYYVTVLWLLKLFIPVRFTICSMTHGETMTYMLCSHYYDSNLYFKWFSMSVTTL